MDLRHYVLCVSCLVLAITGVAYGFRFMKRQNYLLGLEWFILAFSSTNFLVFNATGWPALYRVAHFFDAFSRGFGVPVIGVAGLMAVTHSYKPSWRQDILLFAVAIVGTIVIVNADFMAGPLPYFYLIMWAAMAIYLIYVVTRLLAAGDVLNAVTLMLAIVSSSIIAGIYDFYTIPGEETNIIFNFYVLALLTWAYFTVAVYYAYCALDSAESGTKQYMRQRGLAS